MNYTDRALLAAADWCRHYFALCSVYDRIKSFLIEYDSIRRHYWEFRCWSPPPTNSNPPILQLSVYIKLICPSFVIIAVFYGFCFAWYCFWIFIHIIFIVVTGLWCSLFIVSLISFKPCKRLADVNRCSTIFHVDDWRHHAASGIVSFIWLNSEI